MQQFEHLENILTTEFLNHNKFIKCIRQYSSIRQSNNSKYFLANRPEQQWINHT